MKVYLFDLLPYDKHFDAFKAERFMPYPLPGSHFAPEIAARSYEQHLAQVRRFGREVLPRLQAHWVTRVPAAAADM